MDSVVEFLGLSTLSEPRIISNGKNRNLTRIAITSRAWRGAKHPGTSGKNEAKLLRDRRANSQRSPPREKDQTDVRFASQLGRA